MNVPRQQQLPGDGMRRSRQVALVLLGTAGVIGVAAAWDAWRNATPVTDTTATGQPVAPPISVDRTYTNNDYVPGAGYYHAPQHAWFPYPYNYHDPARGYFAGGLWRAMPWVVGFMQSQPTPNAAQAALAAQRQEEQRRKSSSSFFGGGYRTGTSGFSSAHPGASPAPASHPSSHPSILRGGFGGSAHGIGGGT
jgi:hypothetical protein